MARMRQFHRECAGNATALAGRLEQDTCAAKTVAVIIRGAIQSRCNLMIGWKAARIYLSGCAIPVKARLKRRKSCRWNAWFPAVAIRGPILR